MKDTKPRGRKKERNFRSTSNGQCPFCYADMLLTDEQLETLCSGVKMNLMCPICSCYYHAFLSDVTCIEGLADEGTQLQFAGHNSRESELHTWFRKVKSRLAERLVREAIRDGYTIDQVCSRYSVTRKFVRQTMKEENAKRI